MWSRPEGGSSEAKGEAGRRLQHGGSRAQGKEGILQLELGRTTAWHALCSLLNLSSYADAESRLLLLINQPYSSQTNDPPGTWCTCISPLESLVLLLSKANSPTHFSLISPVSGYDYDEAVARL